jgi:hypothetical protein
MDHIVHSFGRFDYLKDTLPFFFFFTTLHGSNSTWPYEIDADITFGVSSFRDKGLPRT